MTTSAFTALRIIERAAIRVYFRRLSVVHPERLPAQGAALLAVNHPAAWTDVLVLDAAFRRKLHFLAQRESYFTPLGAALLHIHKSLPVEPHDVAGDPRSRHRDMFDRCHELFDRGHVVAIFPEGVSEADRSVLALKTGAARIALEYEPARSVALALVPAGIHYANRTMFGSEVTVSVGAPIDLRPFRGRSQVDPEAAVHELTERLRHALAGLILDLPDPLLAAAVAELTPLTVDASSMGMRELESSRRVAARLEQMRIDQPARSDQLQRHLRAYRRARRALRLSDHSLLSDHRTKRWRQRTATLVLLCALGAVPAVTGAVLHFIPWIIGESLARRATREPPQISFARIGAGMVLFPAAYLVLLGIMVRGFGLSVPLALIGLIAILALGLWTLRYRTWALALWERTRLGFIASRHSRLVHRAREEQRNVLRILGPGFNTDASSGDFAAQESDGA